MYNNYRIYCTLILLCFFSSSYAQVIDENHPILGRLENPDYSAPQRKVPLNNLEQNRSSFPSNFTEGFDEALFSNILEGNSCFDIINIQVISVDENNQVGSFSNGIDGSGLSIDEGIILTTGTVQESFSDNSSTGSSSGTQNANLISDQELDSQALNGNSTHDEAILIIDFTVSTYIDGFQIPFQFASEEYNEYVCSSFNDVFSVFIRGNGISDYRAISLVPETSNPVSINYVNNGECGNSGTGQDSDLNQSDLFIDNSSNTIHSEYDGFTTMLYASNTGLPPGNYQLKLAIADLVDPSFDSAVFFGGMEALSGGIAMDCNCLSNPLSDPNGDCDGDGIANRDEASASAALNPCDPDPNALPNGDCDGDGITNQNEANINELLDPCLPEALGQLLGDCDSDGVLNGDESDSESAKDPCSPNPMAFPNEDCDGDGIINSNDDCPLEFGTAATGCMDEDGDGIKDSIDIDDDNDGVLDTDEMLCTTNELSSFTFSGNAISSYNSTTIETNSNGYITSYSNDVLSAPLSLKFRISTNGEQMIGIIPTSGTKTPNGWNDDAYKFYNLNGALYGKLPNLWNPSGLSFSQSDELTIEVDETGFLIASLNGTELVSVQTNETEFNLVITSGRDNETINITEFKAENLTTCQDLDTDLDGIPNAKDTDSDNDNCSDAFEAGSYITDLPNFSLTGADANLDGLVDFFDPNLDGIPDYSSTYLTTALDPLSIACENFDTDEYSYEEETQGICGIIGDPFDINSPFKHIRSIASGTFEDAIWALSGSSSPVNFQEGENAHLIISSGNTIEVSSNAVVRDLIIENGGKLVFSGSNKIEVHGNIRIDGELMPYLGHIHMKDDCKQRIISGSTTANFHELTIENPHGVILETSMEVSGPIQPELGVFNLMNESVLLTSYSIDDQLRTGSISEIKENADVIGEITLQRLVESSEDGYRFLGPPIRGLSIEDIADDFITTGFEGSDYPDQDFTNLKFYEEDQRTDTDPQSGYKDVSSRLESLKEFQGYWAYFPPSTNSITLDASGEFYKGDIQYDLTFTDTSTDHCDGWHCIINPYPSAVDLNSACVDFHNVSKSIYILDHTIGGTWQGEYAVYNNGVSVNGGTNVLASFQAFMVQASGPGAFISFSECAKTDEQGVFFRDQVDQKSFMRFNIKQGDDFYETVIAFDDTATEGYDPELDARRWNAEMYSLATIAGEDTLSINTLRPDFENLNVPFCVHIPEPGDYSLNISELQNIPQNSCFTIVDQITGEKYPVNENGTIEFSITEENYSSLRFRLVGKKMAQIFTNPPHCSNENSGSALVSLNSHIQSHFKWYDFNMNLIFSAIGSQSELSNVPSGTYYVEITSEEAACTSFTLEVEIESGDGEVVEVNSTPDYCSGGFANLKVKVLGAEHWTVSLFHDYQLIASGQSFELVEFTDLEGLIYDVVVETPCSYNEYVVDLKDPDTVTSYFETPNLVHIENITEPVEIEALSENADTYQWFLNEYFQGEDDVISLTFSEIGNYTLKLNCANEFCEDSYQQEIIVTAANAVEENIDKDLMIINRTDQLEIFGLSHMSLNVSLYDSKGSLVFEKTKNSNGKITINKSELSSGIYILEVKADGKIVHSQKYSK